MWQMSLHLSFLNMKTWCRWWSAFCCCAAFWTEEDWRTTNCLVLQHLMFPASRLTLGHKPRWERRNILSAPTHKCKTPFWCGKKKNHVNVFDPNTFLRTASDLMNQKVIYYGSLVRCLPVMWYLNRHWLNRTLPCGRMHCLQPTCTCFSFVCFQACRSQKKHQL